MKAIHHQEVKDTLKANSSFAAPFSSYWRPTRNQTESFTRAAIIALDTNVLLDLYRVTPQAREEILTVLQQVADRIFIPHQVALEFHKNRVRVAKDQIDFYASTRKGLESLKEQAVQKVNEFANRCALTVDEKNVLSGTLVKAFKNATGEIQAYEDRFDLTVNKVLNEDPVLARLSTLLHGKVGPGFDDEQHAAALKEASRRVEAQVPPGYRDGGKDANAHGDYFLWEQVLLEAERRKMPVLMVSNDNKEDWVHKELNFTIGPRCELVEEMKYRAGVNFQTISFPGFLEIVKKEAPAAVSDQTLDQAKMAQRREFAIRYPTFTMEVPESTLESLRKEFSQSMEWSEENVRMAERMARKIGPSTPDYEKEIAELEIASAHRMRESIRDDADRIERAISSVAPTERGVIIEVPEYMRRRLLGVLSKQDGRQGRPENLTSE
ncbi:PIN domain-containing protein [Streptomyces sp. NPDC059568]|uniref:PIN domain-containing protein n=1 Tax=Streptomyces sp. NPDC059568 TaxID=3346868 RepID=UPI0036A4498B